MIKLKDEGTITNERQGNGEGHDKWVNYSREHSVEMNDMR